MSLRFLVLENHAPDDVRRAAVQLAGQDGASLLLGWRTPVPPNLSRGSLVRVGPVATASDAADAVLAAVGGDCLVMDAAGADRDVIDRLCDDLRRLGVLDHRVSTPRAAPLDEVQRRLLAMLMGGATLGQAARALHLSRRTADRRLAAARRVLEVETTSEAVATARRLGVEPEQP